VVFPERFDSRRFLDFECVTLLNAIEKIFSNHSLNSLPIVRANGVTGLQINFGSPEPLNKTSGWKANQPKH
jgi:hypothetical protein